MKHQQADLESWSSNNGGQFENPRVQSTKFVMPAGDVEVHFGLDSNQQFKTKNQAKIAKQKEKKRVLAGVAPYLAFGLIPETYFIQLENSYSLIVVL